MLILLCADGSCPFLTGPTHGEGRLQPHPGGVYSRIPNVRKSPRSGLNLEGRLSDRQISSFRVTPRGFLRLARPSSRPTSKVAVIPTRISFCAVHTTKLCFQQHNIVLSTTQSRFMAYSCSRSEGMALDFYGQGQYSYSS